MVFFSFFFFFVHVSLLMFMKKREKSANNNDTLQSCVSMCFFFFYFVSTFHAALPVLFLRPKRLKNCLRFFFVRIRFEFFHQFISFNSECTVHSLVPLSRLQPILRYSVCCCCIFLFLFHFLHSTFSRFSFSVSYCCLLQSVRMGAMCEICYTQTPEYVERQDLFYFFFFILLLLLLFVMNRGTLSRV